MACHAEKQYLPAGGNLGQVKLLNEQAILIPVSHKIDSCAAAAAVDDDDDYYYYDDHNNSNKNVVK